MLDEAVTLLQHGVRDEVRPHPAALEGIRHAIVQLVERATQESPKLAPPTAPRLAALREAGVPTVDDDTFERCIAALTGHRRRVAHFATESF